MAIQINGSTVIDNSENLILDGSVSGGIIATTAEAQAATADDVIMTPAKVKDLLQGGNASVVKRVLRYSASMGVWGPGGGGSPYNNWGSVTRSAPNGGTLTSSNGLASFYSPDADAALFCYIDMGLTVDPNKTFLTVTQGGGYTYAGNPSFSATAANRQLNLTMVRLYDHSPAGFPTSNAQYIQLSTSHLYDAGDNYNATTGEYVRPEVHIELVEFY